LVEHSTLNRLVVGSIPTASTNIFISRKHTPGLWSGRVAVPSALELLPSKRLSSRSDPSLVEVDSSFHNLTGRATLVLTSNQGKTVSSLMSPTTNSTAPCHFDRTRAAAEGAAEKPVCPPINLTSHNRAFKKTMMAIYLFALLAIVTPLSQAQGCAQCQDNTAATPPRVQASYRHAIILMTIPAAALFLGTLIVFKRYR
jgi:hypothetical protein